jgi:hypothetical protein
MSGFVASPGTPVPPDPAPLECGSFWPDIVLTDFRDAMRVGGTMIADARVRLALLGGVVEVERPLASWRALQEAAGYEALEEVPDSEIGGESRLVILWRRAVYASAAADLLETHRDITVTDAGTARAGMNGETADDHRRNATRAIRAILGVTGTAVELI